MQPIVWIAWVAGLERLRLVFTRDELLAVARVKPLGGVVPMRFGGAAIDSREVRRGELFVALKGEHTDGHLYIEAAVRAGASAVLCARPDDYAIARGVPQVVVHDPLDTLQQLAHQHLLRQPETKVIAIAGSNGKTSVKEASASLLAHMAPILKTEGNLNTETGVPISLLRLTPEHRFAVIEMGAQRVGEVALLCRIAPPHIGVVTVVGPEHLEFFGSMENVIRAEGEVVAALQPDGIAILNHDDKQVRKMRKRTRATVVYYGHEQGVTVRARHVAGDPLTGLDFTLVSGKSHNRVRLNIPGEHAVTTALAAAAVALSCGLNLQTVAAGLGEIRPAKRRGEIKIGVQGSTIVDDSYNANRQSALAAVALLRQAALPDGARRWFVFGDMLELGTFSPQEHAAVGEAACQGIDELVLVGTEVKATAEAARRSGMPAERIHLFEARLADRAALAQAHQQAAAYVRTHIRAGDLVLVKGSLGASMDAVVAELSEHGHARRTRSDISARLRILGQ
jgi:UDP-N-acetylmuramoyl-tripeptide--D-alanyl-D-alanine ligase